MFFCHKNIMFYFLNAKRKCVAESGSDAKKNIKERYKLLNYNKNRMRCEIFVFLIFANSMKRIFNNGV